MTQFPPLLNTQAKKKKNQMKIGISSENKLLDMDQVPMLRNSESLTPNLSFGERNVRSLRAKYQEMTKSKISYDLASIPQLKRGRSFMLGELD